MDMTNAVVLLLHYIYITYGNQKNEVEKKINIIDEL
jgi:hypothetical protein